MPHRVVARLFFTCSFAMSSLVGVAAGSAAPQRCEVTIAVTNAFQANALQIEVDHSAAPAGDFSKDDCVITGAPPAITRVNVDGPTVEVAWINQANVFTSPAVFATCQFFMASSSATLDAADFVPTVKDCTKGINPPVACAPTVSIAVGTCVEVVPVCGNSAKESGEACDEGPNGDATCTARCTPSGGCTDVPLAGCRKGPAGRSRIQLRDDPNHPADSKKDQGQFDWKYGAATDIEELGNPVGAAPSYHWCVYDDDGLVLGAKIPGGGTCDGKPCWKKAGATKFQYKSKTGSADGVAQLKLTAGPQGKAAITLKAKSKAGKFVAPYGMQLADPVISQFIVDDGVDSTCFETTFAVAGKNDARQYSAKGP